MTLTEEQRGTVAFETLKTRFLELNKISGEKNIRIREYEDEIERLRAENLELQVAVFGPDGIRANQACIIADQAARIKELEEAKLRSWQITEERKAALAAMSNLSETISCPDCGVWIGFADIGPHMAVLRAMLREAE